MSNSDGATLRAPQAAHTETALPDGTRVVTDDQGVVTSDVTAATREALLAAGYTETVAAPARPAPAGNLSVPTVPAPADVPLRPVAQPAPEPPVA